MTAPAKVEQRHIDEARDVLGGVDYALGGLPVVAQALADAEQRGREAEREECAKWHDERADHFARWADEDASRFANMSQADVDDTQAADVAAIVARLLDAEGGGK